MQKIRRMFRGFLSDESGQGTVEWVLITALVVVAIFILIYAFRDKIKSFMEEAQKTVEGWSQ